MRSGIIAFAVIASIATAGPAAAQFSDSYNFIKAVRDKDVQKAREILNKPGTTIVNAREQSTGDAPIHIVTRQRDLAWLGFLLQANADPNIRDRDGNSPLLLAATARFAEGVRVLLLVHANVDQRNNSGETPLIKAVQANDLDDTKLLLDASANPDLTDNTAGFSARQYAAQGAHQQMIKLLAETKPRAAAPMQGPPR
jgi:ankyrin repeat protein